MSVTSESLTALSPSIKRRLLYETTKSGRLTGARRGISACVFIYAALLGSCAVSCVLMLRIKSGFSMSVIPQYQQYHSPSPSRRGSGNSFMRYLLFVCVWAGALAAFLLFRALPQRDSRRELPLQPRSLFTPQCMAGDQYTLEVFTTMRPFLPEELDEMRQFENPLLHPVLLPVASWLMAGPRVSVVWLGNHPSYWALKAMLPVEYRSRLIIEPFVDTNFQSKPLFHSMWRRAEASRADFVAFTNGDIYIQSTVWDALFHATCRVDDFILIACRMDMAEQHQLLFDVVSHPSSENRKALRELVAENATVHDYGGIDLWLWNNRRASVPVMPASIPPFTFGRAKYDNWITHELIQNSPRRIIDVTHIVSIVHVEHARTIQGKDRDLTSAGNFWSSNKMNDWDIFANVALSLTHGSYVNQMGTSQFAPSVILPCEESSTNGLCLLRRQRPGVCPCEHAVWANQAQSDPRLDKVTSRLLCGAVKRDDPASFAVNPVQPAGGLHTLEALVAGLLPDRNGGGNRKVIVLAATMDYKDVVMNWVCTYRRITQDGGKHTPFIIAALDEDFFRFGFLNGLPVFLPGNHTADGSDGDCAYGTTCFRAITKLKSRIVLEIVQMGVDVLFTDADIVWFKDPLQQPALFGGFESRTTIFVQSNEPDETLPLNGIRRINSGFYFIPSSPENIAAFSAVVTHAAGTTLSEQPSFYDVLCGVNGETRVGTEKCEFAGVTVQFLSLEVFPNGASFRHWDAWKSSKPMSAEASCTTKNCVVLHNNWISGIDAKADRLRRERFWRINEDGTCLYDWRP
jgi:hypothetical protein